MRCKDIRQTDQIWDVGRLTSLSISPSDLLKLATHSKVRVLPLPAPQPVAIQNAATPDEAASDPPSEDERGGNVGEDQGIEGESISPLVLDGR